ncbi:MAG: hypothetical protein HY700_07480 [Gemmatimonadetes bacterium]|nr:hypothetical protein [Gemmatimonadota bacterium]
MTLTSYVKAARLLAFLVLAAACKDTTEPPVVVPPHDNHIIDSTMMVPAPTLAASVAIPPQYGIHDTFIRDGIALVCAWNSGLMLYDVGNGIKGGSPSSPVLISSLVTNANGVAGGAAVHNAWWFHNPVTNEKRYAFVGQEGPATIPSTSSGDIHVVDVSDLAHPQEVAFYHMNTSPAAGTHNFWMDEPAQILYAAYYNGGVVALDVSGTLSGDLSSRELARYQPSPTSNFVWGVQLSGGSLYVIDLLNGFYQLKYANRAFTTASGGGNVPERYSSDLWVTGQYAYTGTWGATGRAGVSGNTLKTWRLSASGAPALADSLRFIGVGTISDVKGTDDGRLLIASAESGPNGGVYVFKLTDPTFPTLVAKVLVQGGVHTVKLADIGGKRYVFAAKNPGSAGPALLIYDVESLAQ